MSIATQLNKQGVTYADILNNWALNTGQIQTPTDSTITSANRASSENPLNRSTGSGDNNKPQPGSNGLFYSAVTGQPFHGTYTDPATGAKSYYSNGKLVSDISMVGNQNPNFQVFATAKNPAVSQQVSSLITRNASNGDALTSTFRNYLDEANRVNAEAKGQLAQDQAAINPDGTINRMNADVSSAATGLSNRLNQYTTDQQGVIQKVAGQNDAYKSDVSSRIDDLKAKLEQQNAAYGQAAQNVARDAYAKAQKNINLYHLTSGTPTSGSGNLDNRYIRAYSDINVPLQQDLANRGMALTNQIYGLQSGLTNQDYQNRINQYAGESALNTDLANRYNSNTQYLTGLDQNTAQYVQSLRQATAGMSRDMAAKYLEQLRVPINVGQAVLSGDIANLSAIQGLDERANAYTFTTPYQNRAPQFPITTLSAPQRSYVSDGGGGNQPLNSSMVGDNSLAASQQSFLNTPQGKAWLAANGAAPQTTTGTSGAPNWIDLGNGNWRNPNDGQVYRQNTSTGQMVPVADANGRTYYE